MSALDQMNSLDSILKTIKEEHATEMQKLKDSLLAAELQTTLCQKALADAAKERDKWMRIATKLVTQFSTVEQVFAEAKRIALSMPETDTEKADGLSDAVAGIKRIAEEKQNA